MELVNRSHAGSDFAPGASAKPDIVVVNPETLNPTPYTLHPKPRTPAPTTPCGEARTTKVSPRSDSISTAFPAIVRVDSVRAFFLSFDIASPVRNSFAIVVSWGNRFAWYLRVIVLLVVSWGNRFALYLGVIVLLGIYG